MLPPGAWRIEADADGRPLVVGGDGSRGPDLSLSHSGAWVAAALAGQGRVGVDVETLRPGRDARGIADAWLSQPERRAVAAEGQGALLAFWCMREAVAKAIGGGLAEALGLDGAILPEGRGGSCGTSTWVVAHRQAQDLHIALAWSGPGLAPGRCRWLEDVLAHGMPVS
ncbi:4'-phosphopantetheinyl transferase superfamily protein [Magnetospirillum sp. UT-4]|uniref:4'-phosphopantetheinyl transferase family protein n=1 Tax=Magnetospirillum sp. UT-4 TaxID=2681467 RepID=UPI00157231C5|nr:4'-phosphopantetheinyl transferase superfamily protein [Magnetospirillum sp. UT-4]